MKELTIFLCSLFALSNAFVRPVTFFGATLAHSCRNRHALLVPLQLASNDDFDSALARNKARTDVRNLLTQRSIQSFIFLLIETRDPHTVTYLEDHFGWSNLENFHGTGALNMTLYPSWDTVLLELMDQPPAIVVVRAKRRGRGHGGWSKNNPYLEERFMEFEIDIDPVSLASRIMSVREQLAAEWNTDLDVLISANDHILESYHDNAMDARDNQDDEHSNKGIFDRTTMAMGDFGVFGALAPSPLRKGNFDLLVLLATQESVHRLLREYQGMGDHKVEFEWLREFYSDRIQEYFDGNGGYGRADNFIEELLLTPPSVKKKSAGGKAELIDPLRIAEDVIRMRTHVALDWKDVCANVPEEHTEVRKVLLAKQMLKWGNTPEVAEQVAEESEQRKMGEFE